MIRRARERSRPGRWAIVGYVLAVVATVATTACNRSPKSRAEAPSAPPDSGVGLVVMLVVDQLDESLLERYDDLFTGGFRRLLDEGRVYVNATHDHAVTKTAPGHATLATGVYPSRHGVIANEWYEPRGDDWAIVENVQDTTERITGGGEAAGVSPRKLMAPAFADWLRAAHPEALVASVSRKDRAAVLPAGHVRGYVYWFEPGIPGFVTSTYYRDDVPPWVSRFNEETLESYRSDTVWASTVPDAARRRTSPDTAAYEADGKNTAFPHRYSVEGRPGAFWSWLELTPALDAMTLDFAETAVAELGMGGDGIPDFLNVSLSQTDRVGHDYGPRSREQLDNLLRLDRRLGRFFQFLDERVGRDRWIAALSADHGVSLMPETLGALLASTARRATPGERQLLDSMRAAPGTHGASAAPPESIAAALERLDFIADAWTFAELRQMDSATAGDSFAVLASRSIYPGRFAEDFGRAGVEARFNEGFLEDARGSEHGSPYWYDRNVPMIFLGPEIPAGHDSTRVATVDFAPTLARLLGVPAPDGLDGTPLAAVTGGGGTVPDTPARPPTSTAD